MAAHYNVELLAAHSSREDALASARILWRQRSRYAAIRNLSLGEMQEFQRAAHVAWAEGFEAYRAKKGQPVSIDRAWPMRTEVRP
jgi:DNA polymerase-3 subunit epsilon